MLFDRKPILVFVDDEPYVLESLKRVLRRRDEWTMRFFSDPLEALDHMTTESVDTVVADVHMPSLDGLELMSRMQHIPTCRDVPVIFLTGEGDHALRREALESGATDFLTKPFDSEELCARLRVALRLKSYQDELKKQNELLAEKVLDRTQALNESRLDLIWRLAKAAEYRDEETGNHVVRVGSYSRVIAEALGLDHDTVEMLYVTAPLHDIGKIGIPDSILLKPGKLTGEEWTIMKTHCDLGAEILAEESKAMRHYLTSQGLTARRGRTLDDPMMKMAIEIVMSHHERWDGTGYPRRLAGEDIPLVGRIVAISDVFDALTSERPYKAAYSEQRSLDIIRGGVGTQFDAAVFEAFVQCFSRICDIRAEFSDSPPTRTVVNA